MSLRTPQERVEQGNWRSTGFTLGDRETATVTVTLEHPGTGTQTVVFELAAKARLEAAYDFDDYPNTLYVCGFELKLAPARIVDRRWEPRDSCTCTDAEDDEL